MPLTEDEAVIESHSMFMTALLERIICAMKNIKLFDHKTSELMKILPDAELFTTLPGVGACLSARLLSAFVEQRDRFTSAQQLQVYHRSLSVVVKNHGCIGVGNALNL